LISAYVDITYNKQFIIQYAHYEHKSTYSVVDIVAFEDRLL